MFQIIIYDGDYDFEIITSFKDLKIVIINFIIFSLSFDFFKFYLLQM